MIVTPKSACARIQVRATAGRSGQNSAYGLLRFMKPLLRIVSAIVFVSIGYVAAQQLGAGQIRPRPAEGREPEFPPPNIREYKPRSTLIVPAHPVPRAKFPVVDFHGHPPPLTSAQPLDLVVDSMTPLNLQVMVNANSTTADRLRQSIDLIRASKYKDRMVMFTGLDLRNVQQGSGQRIARQLEADIQAGALGIGEIMKNFGLSITKADGTRLHLDDPELDP